MEEQTKKRIGFNITSMILGIVSLLFCCIPVLPIICGVLSIIFFICGIKRDGRGYGIAGLILSIFAIILGCIFLIVIFSVNNQTTVEKIEFDGDEIPTIYSIVGERKVQGISSEVNLTGKYKTLKYSDDIISNNDITKYVQELKKQGYTVKSQNTYKTLLNINSKESGKDINVLIEQADGEVAITYSKVKI